MTTEEPLDRPCWIRVAPDRWVPGIVLRWSQLDGRWRARVEWSEGPGMTHRTSFWADDVRPREEETPAERRVRLIAEIATEDREVLDRLGREDWPDAH